MTVKEEIVTELKKVFDPQEIKQVYKTHDVDEVICRFGWWVLFNDGSKKFLGKNLDVVLKTIDTLRESNGPQGKM